MDGSEESFELPEEEGSTGPLDIPSIASDLPTDPPRDGAADNEDAEDETLFGELLDSIPQSETIDTGETIFLRDFSNVKGTTSALRSPRQLLEDALRKISPFVKIDWQDLSTTRVKRARLKLHWPSNTKLKLAHRHHLWDSGNVGCPDQKMARDYVSVLALYDLVESGLTNTPVEKYLSASFRLVWDELEAQKKERSDQKARLEMRLLTSILDEKMELASQKKSVRPRLTNEHEGPNVEPHDESREVDGPAPPSRASDPIGLRDEWLKRAGSAAYKRMSDQRNQLPIASYRKTILETLENNQVVVLCGETGCGKSTQVPSFILEDQLLRDRECKIICTEPRRISAISLAARVSSEIGEAPADLGTPRSLVGYSIRLENQVSKKTRLVYATTGIVLRMLEGSSELDEWTHLLLDEVHERSIETDFLLIVLKTLLAKRKDLKVILMSATVDADKFATYMGHCPVLQVPGRTFPVTTQYLEDVIQLTNFILPDNSPFVLRDDRGLQGKRKTTQVSDSNEDGIEFGSDDETAQASIPTDHAGELQSYSTKTRATLAKANEYRLSSCYELVVRLLECICLGSDLQLRPYSRSILVFLPGLAEIKRLHNLLLTHDQFGHPEKYRVFPLHSSISNNGQSAVFNSLPDHQRKIVLATNIAETGITIPDIVCVIDLGKHKEMRFDEKRQISVLSESFVSKANAKQRRGRAGRVQAGLCFHLFTRMRHDKYMAEHPQPEMERLSLQDLALRIKICKISGSIEDVLMQALSPPKQQNIRQAIQALIEVKALTSTEELTPLGVHLSKLPMDVHLGKLLLLASIFKCLDPILTIAASLNSKSPFVAPFGMEREADRAKKGFAKNESDFMTLVAAFDAWRRVSMKQPESFEKTWLRRNYLSRLVLGQIEELRQQYLGFLVDGGFVQMVAKERRALSRARDSSNARPSFSQLPAYLDQYSNDIGRINACLAAALYPKLMIYDSKSGSLKTILNNQFASLHPSSIIHGQSKNVLFTSRLVAYYSIVKSYKLYVREAAAIDEIAVMLLCGDLESRTHAGVLDLDRRLRYKMDPEMVVLFKILRRHTTRIIGKLIEHPDRPLNETQKEWFDLASRLISQTLTGPDKATAQIVI